MHLRQQIEEDCNFHPDYIWCIEQLRDNYSTFELEQLESKYIAEEISARNALLFAPKGEQGELLDKLRQAMMANIMLRKVLENNKEKS
ncbi:MAG: hypothetical protein J6X55_13425 [Victivallales bacterium]|nr:hypothetical protein [Victivallales bacterium]